MHQFYNINLRFIYKCMSHFSAFSKSVLNVLTSKCVASKWILKALRHCASEYIFCNMLRMFQLIRILRYVQILTNTKLQDSWRWSFDTRKIFLINQESLWSMFPGSEIQFNKKANAGVKPFRITNMVSETMRITNMVSETMLHFFMKFPSLVSFLVVNDWTRSW